MTREQFHLANVLIASGARAGPIVEHAAQIKCHAAASLGLTDDDLAGVARTDKDKAPLWPVVELFD